MDIFFLDKKKLKFFPWLNRVGGSEPPGPNLRAARSTPTLVFSLFNHTELDVSIPRGYPGPKDVKGVSTDTKGV